MATDLSRFFRTTMELYTSQHIPAGTNGLPAGWRIGMPVGSRHVTVDMFNLEPGKRGAFRLRVTKRLFDDVNDPWEEYALEHLEHLLAVIVTARQAVPETAAEGIAKAFHSIWTTGSVDLTWKHVRYDFAINVDASDMRWVGVVR